MYLYLWLFFWIAMYGLFGKVNRTEKSKKMYLCITFGSMAIISALRRYDVGIDLKIIYKPIFEELSRCAWKNIGYVNIETGYAILNKLLLEFTTNFQVYIFFTSFFINFTYARFIYKNSRDVAISTSLYLLLDVFFMEMNIIRQELAICILLYSYEYIKENKKTIPIILTMLAISIHTSAIIWIVCFFIKNIKVTFNRFMGAFIIMLIMILLLDTVLPVISNIIYDLGLSNNKNYNYYLNGSIFGQGKVNLNSSVNIIIALVIYLLTYEILFSKGKNTDKKYNFLFYATLLYMFFNICILKIYVLSRFLYYFLPFVLIVVPEFFYEIRNKDNQKIIFYMSYLFLIVRYIYVCINLANKLYGVVPYNLFWK